MDYEKKYNEALERARKQKYDYQKELNKTDKNSQLAGLLRAGISALEMAFPELHESEDERMMRNIKAAFELAKKASPVQLIFDEEIAWLEEQKDKNCLACDQHLKGYIAGRKVTEEEKQEEHWKPSEEQMRILNWAANGMVDNSIAAPEMRAVLRELYEQLKRIKED